MNQPDNVARVIGALALLVAFGGLVVSMLNYLRSGPRPKLILSPSKDSAPIGGAPEYDSWLVEFVNEGLAEVEVRRLQSVDARTGDVISRQFNGPSLSRIVPGQQTESWHWRVETVLEDLAEAESPTKKVRAEARLGNGRDVRSNVLTITRKLPR